MKPHLLITITAASVMVSFVGMISFEYAPAQGASITNCEQPKDNTVPQWCSTSFDDLDLSRSGLKWIGLGQWVNQYCDPKDPSGIYGIVSADNPTTGYPHRNSIYLSCRADHAPVVWHTVTFLLNGAKGVPNPVDAFKNGKTAIIGDVNGADHTVVAITSDVNQKSYP